MTLQKSIILFKAAILPLKKRQYLGKFRNRQYIYLRSVLVIQISISAMINTIP